MLSADSRALKNESDDQSRPIPPMIPSAAALSCTRRTSLMMLLSDVPGKACFSSLMKKSDASARCARPKRDSARKISGTNERSAKYATIAARCVPRSAKNLCASWRRRMVTDAKSAPWRPRGAAAQPLFRRGRPDTVGVVDAGRALADLVEISPQIEAAAVMTGDGSLAGSVGVPEGHADAVARAARELL